MQTMEDLQRQGRRGGFVAGLTGGLAMLLFDVFVNGDPSLVMKAASIPLLQARAVTPGFDLLAIVLGLLIHFGIAVFWGIAFGTRAIGIAKIPTAVAGPIWGVFVWAMMMYVVLPMADLVDVTRSMPVTTAILRHVVFGLALGLGFLPYQVTLDQPSWRTIQVPGHRSVRA